MFQTSGIIRYYYNWVMAWLDDDGLDKYYRALLPKAWGVCPPMRPAHVSIVRLFEAVPNREAWGKFEGQSLLIDYYPEVQTDGTYYWLDCFSDEIGCVRRSLGLSSFRENDGFSNFNCYHVTIGNTKCQKAPKN